MRVSFATLRVHHIASSTGTEAWHTVQMKMKMWLRHDHVKNDTWEEDWRLGTKKARQGAKVAGNAAEKRHGKEGRLY